MENKAPQLVAFDDVLHRPIDKWECSPEALDMYMYPICEKFMIAFPNMSVYMSKKYIKGRDAAKFWNSVCKDKYGYKFTAWQKHKKPTPVQKEKKDKNDILSNDDIIYGYSDLYGYDVASVKSAITYFPDEMKKELSDYKTDFIDSKVKENKDEEN